MTKEQTTFLNLYTTIDHISLVVDSNQNFNRDHDIAKIVINIAAEALGKPIDFCSSCVRDAYIELTELVTGNQYDRNSVQMQIQQMFENKTKTNERNKTNKANS